MKLVTSSNPSPSSDMGVVLTAVLFLRTLLLSLLNLRPRRAELSAAVLPFSCICRWCGRGEPGNLQSQGHQDGSKESTEFYFPSGLWMSSTPSRWPVGIGRATAGILVSLQSLFERHLPAGDHRPLCMSFHYRSF